ncbi:MAG: response regulator [Candidatus Aminicenantes bacterium]|nr:response regulator [Candidatus Aminicenantes bacterium]
MKGKKTAGSYGDEYTVARPKEFKVLFNSIPIGLYRSTPDGRILLANDALISMLGFPDLETLMSIRVPDLFINPGHREEETKVLLQVGDVRRYEFSLRRYDGREIWVEDYARVIRDAEGRIGFYEGSMIDITARKRIEREIMKSKESADEASRLKSQFLANISHELKTPMNGILSAVALMDMTKVSETQGELLEIIRSSGKSLMRIVESLIDLTRLGAGQLGLQDKEFTPVEALRQALLPFQRLAEEKGLALRTVFHQGIHGFVRGDEERFKQIFSNILDNAVKFTARGGIAVEAFPEPGGLHIRVADTGIGIPADKLCLLFEPFSQVDSSFSRKYGGTGLGTAIARHLVELMGGRIWTESPNPEAPAETPGCVFHYTIKLPPAAAPAKPAPTRPHPRPRAETSSILLVEDNAVNQKLIARLLQKMGLEVDIAGNGAEALEVLAKKSYDLILMDIQMPVMSGLEATRLIRERKIDVPVVALTAHALDNERDLGMAAGMDDYLTKPVDVDRLADVLKKFLR